MKREMERERKREKKREREGWMEIGRERNNEKEQRIRKYKRRPCWTNKSDCQPQENSDLPIFTKREGEREGQRKGEREIIIFVGIADCLLSRGGSHSRFHVRMQTHRTFL